MVRRFTLLPIALITVLGIAVLCAATTAVAEEGAGLFLVADETLELVQATGARVAFDEIHDYGQSRLVWIDNVAGLPANLASLLTRIEDPSRVAYGPWVGAADVVSLDGPRDGYFVISFNFPVDHQWLQALVREGFQVVDTAYPFGVVVHGDAANLSRLSWLGTSAGYEVVRGMQQVPLEARIDPDLLAIARGQRAAVDVAGLRTANDGRLAVRVIGFSDQNQRALSSAVSYEAQAAGAVGYGYADSFLLDAPDAVKILASYPGVQYVELLHERQLMNNLAAKSTVLAVENVWSLGYDGNGVKVNHNDGGIDLNGVGGVTAFPTGVVTATAGTHSGTDNAHGTHTAGSVAGRATSIAPPTNTSGCGDLTTPLTSAKGMAPGATLNSNNLFDPGTTGKTTEDAMMKWGQDNGSQLSTNSWGYTTLYTYNSGSATIDRAVRDADTGESGQQPLTIIFAAGNDGSGAGTIGAPGNAKNALTVGASYNVRCGSYGASYDSAFPGTFDGNLNKMVNFSGRGPSQGRIKPDLVATGANVLSNASDDASADHSWDESWTGTSYELMPGTSMATPIVAGAAAVFNQYYKATQGGSFPSPALTKAALINGAVAMTGYTYENTATGTYAQGWGRLNLKNSVQGPTSGTIKYVEQAATGLTTGQSYTKTFTNNSTSVPLKVSVAWTDPEAASGSTAPLKNNLNLVVTAPDGTIYRGNRFTGVWSTANPGTTTDTTNNVENVFVQSPATGSWTITVTSASTVTNVAGKTGQDFALAYSGNVSDGGTVTPDYTLAASPADLSVGKSGSGTSTITASATGGFASSISLSTSGLPAGTTAAFSPTSIASGSGSSTLTFSVGATTAAGTYLITVTGVGGGLTRTTSVSLTVTAGCSSSMTPITSGASLNGTLATTDCTIIAGAGSGNAYYDSFTFAGTSGDNVTITLNSTAFDAYLRLKNPSGTQVAYNDDGNGGTNSKITYTLAATGTFKIEASTYYATGGTNTVVGAYTVTFTGGSSPTAPAAPSSLAATATSSSQINLTWSDNSSNETGFEVDRSTNGTTWTQITTTAAGATGYSATGLTASTLYYFRVRATNTVGDSANSNTASTTTLSTGGELVVNGGFEATGTWTYGTYASRVTTAPQAGSYCAKLLGRGTTTTSGATLYQAPSFPTTGATKTLRFYLKISSAEGTTTAYDKLYVRIKNSAGTTLSTLATYTNVNKNTYAGWVQVTLTVSSTYAVSGNRLYFEGTEDSSLQTTFYVDGVSIQ